jgi:hypothetical protein
MDSVFRRLALAIGLLCGVAATQAPEFAQQYRQRLAGAVDELSRIVDQFDAEAASQSLDPSGAVARLEANSDQLARERGAAIRDDSIRLARLRADLAAFKDSGPWRRLAALAIDFDPKTARRTWKDFEPAVPTTLEAFVVGLFGLICGWAATHLFAWPVRRRLRQKPLARSTTAS